MLKVKVVKHGSFNSSLLTTEITEQVRLEGSSGDHLVQPSPSKQGQLEVFMAVSSWVLSLSKDGYSTIPLGNLF